MIRRTKRLARGTPLLPGQSRLRRVPLERKTGALKPGTKGLKRSQLVARPPKRPKLDPTLRDSIRELSGHCCDMCGLQLPERWECHHRRLRSQGGTDDPSNLLALHFGCHDEAHGNRRWARVHGYIVHAGTDPAAHPVWRHGRVWQLRSSAGWVACDQPAGVTPYKREAA